MEKDQISILDDRGLISVSGDDAKDFLQNIISNDITKVSESRTIFSGIFTPQGKYLYEFFVVLSKGGYFLDCDNDFTSEIIEYLTKYKLRSKIEIKNFSSKYVIGLISSDKFKEIQNIEKKSSETIVYEDSLIFIDPRTIKLGARILSSLEKLNLTIKSLNLKIVSNLIFLNKAHLNGIPIKGLHKLKDQLFGLEANFEEINGVDFKKGCYVGQENTARMKLKNKVRKRLLPLHAGQLLSCQDNIYFNEKIIGKVIINDPLPFALIKISELDIKKIFDQDLIVNTLKVRIIKPFFITI